MCEDIEDRSSIQFCFQVFVTILNKTDFTQLKGYVCLQFNFLVKFCSCISTGHPHISPKFLLCEVCERLTLKISQIWPIEICTRYFINDSQKSGVTYR